MSLLELDRVGKSFGPNTAVEEFSLAVTKGEFISFLGPSGCGKTTTLQMIAGFLDPSHGTIRLEGKDLVAMPPAKRGLGIVFQSYALFPHMTVAANIGITPRLLGTAPKAVAARVDELLDLVQLDRAAHRNRLPDALSGGQRQRVGVARALSAGPRIVLMDEPFGALDPLTRDTLGSDYRALHAQLGLTTVMITHDITEALLLADRIAVMRSGHLVEAGTPAALAASREPYVAELMTTPRRQAARLAALLPESGAA